MSLSRWAQALSSAAVPVDGTSVVQHPLLIVRTPFEPAVKHMEIPVLKALL